MSLSVGLSRPAGRRSAKIEWVRWSHMARFMNRNASAACSSSSSRSSPASIRLSVVRQLLDGLLGAHRLKCRQPLGGVVDPRLLPVDPVPVGVDQRLELRRYCLRVASASSFMSRTSPSSLAKAGLIVGVLAVGGVVLGTS